MRAAVLIAALSLVPPAAAAAPLEGLPPPDPADLAAIAACTPDVVAGLACARGWEARCYTAPGGFAGCLRAGLAAWEVWRLSVLGGKIADFETADARRPPGAERGADALRAAEAAFLAFRAADCASERAAWPEGSSEGAGVELDCLFRHTSEQAVWLSIRGVP